MAVPVPPADFPAVRNAAFASPFIVQAISEQNMSDLPLSSPENKNQFADAEAARRQELALDNPDRAGDGTERDSSMEDERALFPAQQCAGLREEWQSIQAGFVDSPRASVEKADALVKKTIDTLANSFADMRNGLEQTWEKDKEVSTEELRLALQNYRSFFQRLLSI